MIPPSRSFVLIMITDLKKNSSWLILAVVFVAAIFATSTLSLMERWDTDPNYSHGYLVLPISILLGWYALRDAPLSEGGELGRGMLNIVAGVVAHLGEVLISWIFLDFIALALVIRGIALIIGGGEWARRLRFPILFLFFMFPLPTAWTTWLALQLQEFVAMVAGAVLNVLFVCYRQGTSLQIAGVKEKLLVAEECSGLRQMIAFLALGALLGHLGSRGMFHRIALLVVAIPVAVFANVVRVLLMGMGARWFGVRWMDSWLHHAPMAFSLPFGILLFLAIDRLLSGPRAKEAGPGDRPLNGVNGEKATELNGLNGGNAVTARL